LDFISTRYLSSYPFRINPNKNYEGGGQMTVQQEPKHGAHKQKTKSIILTIIVSITLIGIVQAEQIKTIKYLMTEPLTLFDLGIYKLDKLINEDPSLTATVTFDGKSNKINLHVIILEWLAKKGGGSASQNKKEAYELVGTVINTIRTKLGVNYQTGKISPGNTALEDCFRPGNGRTIKNEPENLQEDLFNMIEISFRFSGENFNLDGKAALNGTEILFGE
jgi:hypothetical protein